VPEVIVYTDQLTVSDQVLNIILNTAPNLNGIDQEVEVTQASNLVTITE
jgi:hypothetical protein